VCVHVCVCMCVCVYVCVCDDENDQHYDTLDTYSRTDMTLL